MLGLGPYYTPLIADARQTDPFFGLLFSSESIVKEAPCNLWGFVGLNQSNIYTGTYHKVRQIWEECKTDSFLEQGLESLLVPLFVVCVPRTH